MSSGKAAIPDSIRWIASLSGADRLELLVKLENEQIVSLKSDILCRLVSILDKSIHISPAVPSVQFIIQIVVIYRSSNSDCLPCFLVRIFLSLPIRLETFQCFWART